MRKPRARKDKAVESAKNKAISRSAEESAELRGYIDRVAEEKAEGIAQVKFDQLMRQIPLAHKGVPKGDRIYKKFSCGELIALFGGWFTLMYAFSVKNEDETETDYYIASQDVSGIAINERPKINEVIKKMFNKEVYGFAIIAPSTAFA